MPRAERPSHGRHPGCGERRLKAVSRRRRGCDSARLEPAIDAADPSAITATLDLQEPSGAYRYEDQASDLAGFVGGLGLDKFVLIGTSMGGIIAMAYAAEHADRLLGLVINDIGPDAEAGTQRITQMVGSRPDEFATLEEAMAYRRAMSPILAARSAEDQRELALGVLRRRCGRQMGVEDGPGLYPAAGRARRPGAASACGPHCRPCPARPWWCGAATATCSPKPRQGAWSTPCRAANWSECPASATRRPWSNRWCWPPSTAFSASSKVHRGRI